MSDSPSLRIAVIGGGAAGFFAALTAAEQNTGASITIYERSAQVLAKVRISGGGRCNVTHACFDPAQLVTYYPRGGKALRGPFTRFQPRDTVEWFNARGVALKTESDGRMFPVTDNSQTIIDCFLKEARRLGIAVEMQTPLRGIERREGAFDLHFLTGEKKTVDRLILTTGSSPQGWSWAQALGHAIEPPVPSLFTFGISDPRLHGLSGVAVHAATVQLESSKLRQTGPVLITHWGLSGPAVLKLSAWAARQLHAVQYQATVLIDWLPEMSKEALLQALRSRRQQEATRVAPGDARWQLPRRLWEALAGASGVSQQRWTEVSNEKLDALVEQLKAGRYAISSKGVFKDEFVTCGGVRLDEVDFRTLESKRCPGLYFAGEVLDIDAVTGGFNFQSAWTTGYLAGRAVVGAD